MSLEAVITNETAPLPTPILSVRGIGVRFGGLQAVNQLSFEVMPGKITALIGPNGAGKTTVFNLITGEILPDTGVVQFMGEDITGELPHRITPKGLVRTFQDVRVFRQMSALDNVLTGFQHVIGEDFFRPLLTPRRVRESEQRNLKMACRLLKEWGLLGIANRMAADLSYGEQKLVAVCRSLAAEPKLLLLDEPLAGLNNRAVENMLTFLQQLRTSDRTLLLVEHNVGAVMRLADHIIVLHLGEKIAEGTPAEISRHRKVREVYLGG